MSNEDQKQEKTTAPKKRAWTSSKLEASPIIDTTAGTKRRWRFERRFRNFEVRNRFAS